MEEEVIFDQVLRLIKDLSPLSPELSIKALNQIHSNNNSKHFIETLHELHFFDQYIVNQAPIDFELASFGISVLTHSERYQSEPILDNINLEPLLIGLFDATIPAVFSIKENQVAANSISDIISFFIMCMDRPRDTKLCQFILSFADLPVCLHLSKQGMKQFLLKHIDEIGSWKVLLKNARESYESSKAMFIPELLKLFWVSFGILNKGSNDYSQLLLCQNLMRLLIALVQNPVSSPYIRALIKDNHLLLLMKNSQLVDSPIGSLLDKQRDLLKFYMSCSLLSKEEQWIEENEKLSLLFKVLYSHFGEDFDKKTVQQVGRLNSKENLDELLELLPEEEIISLYQYLGFPRPSPEFIESIFEDKLKYKDILKEIIKDSYDDMQGVHRFTEIIASSLYPNEETLWDIDELPYKYKRSTELAVPYLSFWCTSLEDFLSRFYWLYRLDAAYYIRSALEETIKEYKSNNSIEDAAVVKKFAIKYIKPASVGMSQPAEIRAEIQYITTNEEQKANWTKLKQGDTLLLISFTTDEKMIDIGSDNFQTKFGVKGIRGCEVSQIYEGGILNVFMDPFQYKEDSESSESLEFNLMVKKGASVNKYFEVLKAVRELMLRNPVLPKFVEDAVIHGKLSEGTINGSLLNNLIGSLFETESDFKEQILRNETLSEKIKANLNVDMKLKPELYTKLNLTNNQVNTLIEIGAVENQISVVSGMPNTGKTNFCLSLATALIKANPQERVLFLTNTKDTLETTFKYLLEYYPINERYICALGTTALINNRSLSQRGRIDHLLTQRLLLLNDVKKLAGSLDIRYAEEYTCDSALNLFKLHLVPKWQEFLTSVEVEKGVEGEKGDTVLRLFPFGNYFTEHGGQLFTGNYHEDLVTAKLKWRELEDLFAIIKETKALEIIRDEDERERYILSTHAKLIGMTSKYATTHQNTLASHGLTYSTLIINNAGTIPLWESILALSLTGGVKRIILAGDVSQTPVVTPNNRFREITKLNRTLFEMSISLKVPQYEMIETYNLKPTLRRLRKKENVKLTALSNVGLGYDCQWINVVEENVYEEVVNVAEAEYVAATYLYLCLIGYNAKDIAIVCTTKEQKEVIKEIIEVKGLSQKIVTQFPMIRTVSKFQGSKNKILLISLVRAKSKGIFKDTRRFKHLITQATEGIYIFGNLKTFSQLWTETPIDLIVIPTERYKTIRTTDNTELEACKTIHNYEEMYELINTHLINP